jgi:hypothetical protein
MGHLWRGYSGFLRALETQLKPKLAANPELAGYSQLTAHGSHQSVADG